MTFGSTFGRAFSPTFQPKSQAAVAGGGWWDLNGTITSCVAAYQPKGAASFAASLVNLANPGTYNAAAGDEPAFDSTNGWKFGSSKYLVNGYTPVSGLSVIVRVSNLSATSGYAMGVMHSGGASGFMIACETDRMVSWNPGANTINGTYDSSGIFASVYSKETYWNGTDLNDDNLGNWSDLSTQLHIGCYYRESDSSRQAYFTGYIQALAIYDEQLTSTQISNLTTAMNAL